jgi:hypothetical protein
MASLRTSKRLTAIASALCAGVLGASAWGADFTINVPVELRNLNPAFCCARVACGVYGTIQGKVELIASGYQDLFRQNFGYGDMVTTLHFGLNAYPGKDPALAESYNCDLLLGVNGRPSYVQTNQLTDFLKPDGIYPRDTSQPFVVSVHGTIPKPKPPKSYQPPRVAPIPTRP